MEEAKFVYVVGVRRDAKSPLDVKKAERVRDDLTTEIGSSSANRYWLIRTSKPVTVHAPPSWTT